jgi:hypothetical protein
MDPVRNPFAPGAGNPPPELAGRADVLRDIDVALQRVAIGRPTQSSILVGLRGVGKTVLLVRTRTIAEEQSYRVLSVEAHEGKTLAELILPGLQSALYSMSLVEGAKDKARRGLRVLKSFLNGIRVQFNEVEIGLSIDPEQGSADSGDLETDLPNLFLSIGEAARSARKPFVLLIDELQYLSQEEFSALIMSMHKIAQANLPVILVGAGLPQILALAGESKSYTERLFRYPKIGELREEDARIAILKPVQDEGCNIDGDAIKAILNISERYPYFIQQWAHDSWNIADNNTITRSDVEQATAISIRALDDNFFRVRFDRCTPAERRYMRALAEFGTGAHRSGDVASELGVKTQSVGPVRSSLIKKGMIYSPQHGDTAFTVPLFDAYMRRVMGRSDA